MYIHESGNRMGAVDNYPGPDANERLSLVMLAIACIPLASSALVLRAAIGLGLSFGTAATALAAVIIVAYALTSFWLFSHRPWLQSAHPTWDKTAVLTLALTCTAAALCVLCMHRPDADDVIYLPKIVYSLAHPGSTMDATIHEIAHKPVLSLPLSAAPYYPDAYEFLQAAFVHISGVNLFWVYYRLAPTLAVISGVLLLAFNLRYLGVSSRASAVAVLIMVPIFLLMGESHRSFGNFTLVRMFQSKCAFIFFGLPMFVALSLLFFRKPTHGRWGLLLLGVVAISGMTTSALVMLPMLSLPLFLSWWLVFGHDKALTWNIAKGAAYAASLLPALAFALEYRRYAAARVAYESRVNSGFPKSFHGQFDLITGGSAHSPTLLLFVGSAALLALYWREVRHRFLLVASVLTIALYLNPWVASPIMRYLTTENIYWRLFYLLPMPLMLGSAIATLYERAPGGVLLKYGVSLVCFTAIAVAVFVSPTSVARAGNRVKISAYGYPMDPNTDAARACLRLARPGTILAPVRLSQAMAVLSARHPLVVTRPDFLANALTAHPTEYVRRFSAASVISGKGGSLRNLVTILQKMKPSTVIVARPALSPRLEPTLRNEGYRQTGAVDRWIVYGRLMPYEGRGSADWDRSRSCAAGVCDQHHRNRSGISSPPERTISRER